MLIRLLLLSTLAASVFAQAAPPPYKRADQTVDARVRDLLSRMTLEEKFWQLFMIPGDLDTPANDYSHGIFGLQTRPAKGGGTARAHAERINAIQKYFVEQTRLGIPIIPFEEAVHGIAIEGGTMFPAAIGLAATWNTALMSQVAEAIANETQEPRHPPGALTGRQHCRRCAVGTRGGDVRRRSVAVVGDGDRVCVCTFERLGVVTTPKHFVANVGEGGRDSYPVALSERQLIERYYPPFVASLAAGARSVMAAYNSVDGMPAHQNRHLLNDVLKRDWGFKGFVISDASGTSGSTVLHMTEASTATAAQRAFAAGLDVVFQSSYGQQRPYLDAFQRGLIPMEVIDAAVARVLRVKFELGLFEQPYVDANRAAQANGNQFHRALARDAARQAIVLLKNENGALPLSTSMRSIAVIGVDAEEARLGGYSGPGNNKVSILEGIRRAAPGASCPLRRRSRPHDSRVRRRAGVAAVVRTGGPARARACGRVLRQSATARTATTYAHGRAHGFPVDAELARPRHSVRLVLRAMDGHDHGAGRRASAASAWKATTAIGCISTTSSSSTTGRSVRTARASRRWRLRRTRRMRFAWSISRPRATRGSS